MKCKYDKKKKYKKSSKYCIKCQREIDENNLDVKWCMIITKKGQNIMEFECFHFKCWKEFFEESVQMKIKQIK